MLASVLAQSPPTSDNAWTVTTFVALAGAVISLATLVVTTVASSRRERAKWARDTLAEAFFSFVDASYSAAHAAWRQQTGLWDGADAATREAADLEREQQHSALRHHLTRIRLLAPQSTLHRAQILRRAHSDLAEALAVDLDRDRYRQLARATAQARQELIESAKKAMSLPR